jgi:hypothetical protein
LFRIDPNNDSKELVDEKVYPERLNLKPGDQIEKQIEYIFPGYLGGKFELQLIARNKNGFLMGVASLPNISLEKKEDYLEIFKESCFLTTESRSYLDFYDIDKGVDFDLEEKIFLNCRIKNNFSSTLEIKPFFETFFRTTFGEKVETQKLENSVFSIKSGEEKEIKLNFPKALQPQAYDTKVNFYDKKNQVISSNPLIIHYTIKGDNALINNLSIDKNFYKKGEDIKISLVYTKSTNNLFSLNPNLEEDLSFEVKVFDNKNKSCGETLNKEVDGSENYLSLNYRTTKDCQNPLVKVVIMNNNSNNVLYSDNFDFNFRKENQGLILKITLLVLFLIIIFSVMFIMWKKRRNKLLSFFFMIFISGLFFSTAQAEQRSINYSTRPGIGPEGWSEHNLNLKYSLDKQTYKPGDVMTVNLELDGGSDISKYFDLEAKYIERGQIKSRRGADQATLRFMIPEDVEDGRQNLEIKWKDYRYQSIADGGQGPWLEEVYLNTKAQHANQMGYIGSHEPNVGRTAWTGETIKQELSAMGYTPRSHFDEFNETEKAEGVTPYMTLSDFKGQTSILIGVSFVVDSTSSTDQQNDSYVPDDSGLDTGRSDETINKDPVSDDSEKDFVADQESSSVAVNFSTRPGIGPEGWSEHNLRLFYSLDKSDKTYRPGDNLIANIKIENIGNHNFVDYSDLEVKYMERGQIKSRRGANEATLIFRIPDDVENGQQTLEFEWKDYRYQSIADGGQGPWLEEVYLNTKAQHANQMGYTGSHEPNVGRTAWTGETIKQELSAMGYTPRSHFDEFNEAEKAEGVTPYMTLSDFKGDIPSISVKVNFTVDSSALGSGDTSGGSSSGDYNCTGTIIENSEICQGDGENLTSNKERILVDVCTSQNKCEYVCKSGYVKKNNSCIYYKDTEIDSSGEGFGEQRSINYSTRPGIGPEGWSEHNLNLKYSLDKQTYKPGDVMTVNLELDGGSDISKYFDLEAKYIERGQIKSRRGADQATLRFMIPEDVEDGRQNLEIKWKDYRYQSIADGGQGPWLEEVYLNTKAQHANQMGYIGSHEPNVGRTAWTGETIKQELSAMGYTPRSHFDEFNETEKAEGVTPYMTLSDFKGQTSILIGVSFVVDSTSSTDQQNDSYVPDDSGTGGSEWGDSGQDNSSENDDIPTNNSDSEKNEIIRSSLNYKINGQDQSINWTVSLDKKIYAPGEMITATMNMSNAGSGDAVSYGDYYILITGNNWWERKSGGGQSSKTSYFKAPTESGIYEAKFQWQDERYIQAINNQGDYQESDFSAVPSIVKVINFEVRGGGSVSDDVVDDTTDDTGDSDEQNQKPTATINSPRNNTTVSYGELINFSGSGNDLDGGSIMAYEWRDGSCDGYVLDSNPSYKVSYWQAGTRNIYLKVQDNRGDWSTNCPSVTINVVEDEEGSEIDNEEPPVPYLEYAEENQYRKSEGESMSLKEGWNLVTFPNGEYSGAKINNNSATDLSEIKGELEIWEIDEQCSNNEGEGCFSVMPKREGYQELTSLEKNRNYWVYSNSSRSVSFCNRNDQRCLIPISGSADNQLTERFSRGFNLINSTLLNYILNYRSRFNFYVLDWDSDRSKWLITNQENQGVEGFERLRNILESKSYFMYIREAEDVGELNSLISR